MLVGLRVLGSTDAEAHVITGIGFIRGGAILKNVVKGEGFVSDPTTAGSLWSTGAIGISVATGQLEIALILNVLIFFTLRIMTLAKVFMSIPGTKQD